ncbi:tRNA uridine-5-carboxymethylaminomethyl(34) synthesis GTPase MnmE [Martelella alba]|uniref:tRNA modification GTPase MnmE n=1 Tax=Martelella alba TaxID=2590451 RepID=A0A506U660_9HYPH|nr:tRNA uridine-5-carboxymethylaminomethyl(34) synthesis GTPase MnmE [Martelella alba]TPW28455.1 tRNA uridine-5-carboxymethylaminomethyl(34) synthesis GTPase MnmE [Martelella alba]
MAVSDDTIYALSSGGLPSGVAVIRLSGSSAFSACATIAGNIPPPRFARLMKLVDGDGGTIDQALVLSFPGPASFTGEDCIEFHLHGGRAVVNHMQNCLSMLPGLRHAEAGEFTRRAFENGKIDLVEAEGLSDMIAAETEMQRRLALEQAEGHHSALYNGWADRLIHARAMIEAELDFADEDDVPGSLSAEIWQDVEMLAAALHQHLAGSRIGEIVRDGFKVVLTGAPNAGKSSLLNALAKRDIAIVTDIAGTTRDSIEVDLDIGGYAVRLFDTAGLRETEDIVEQEGVRRAEALRDGADLVLALVAADQTGPVIEPSEGVLRILTKSDLRNEADQAEDFDLVLSVHSGDGLPQLVERIATRLDAAVSGSSLSVPVRQRQIEFLQQAESHIGEALRLQHASPEIPAESLRRAADSLGRITGRVDVEDLLGVIFSSFCVGK